jgi:hypothetical protein
MGITAVRNSGRDMTIVLALPERTPVHLQQLILLLLESVLRARQSPRRALHSQVLLSAVTNI